MARTRWARGAGTDRSTGPGRGGHGVMGVARRRKPSPVTMRLLLPLYCAYNIILLLLSLTRRRRRRWRVYDSIRPQTTRNRNAYCVTSAAVRFRDAIVRAHVRPPDDVTDANSRKARFRRIVVLLGGSEPAVDDSVRLKVHDVFRRRVQSPVTRVRSVPRTISGRVTARPVNIFSKNVF